MSKVPTISANNVSWKTAHINNKEVLITFYQGKEEEKTDNVHKDF